ncbi:MAG: ATP-binding cassette domain-containing protein [Tissierellia bacterium]|nr:ATP-binding cassette domain-containing protein [Tissierellia bacterium]
MEYIVETKSLTKKYKNNTAINHVDIQLKKGSIYGLVGRNGAGKTTLMKLISDLINSTDGEIIYYTNGIETKQMDFLKRVGTLIEAPGLYPFMNAFDNIKSILLCGKGSYTKEKIDELIELVGLTPHKEKKVKAYSLGMKQRLGIAVALANDPELLLLDEPINGLDPQGIKHVRSMLKEINESYGTTIVVSSHLLDELSKIATDYCIIDNGKVVLQATKEELEELSGEKSLEEYYFDLVGGDRYDG